MAVKLPAPVSTPDGVAFELTSVEVVGDVLDAEGGYVARQVQAYP